MATSTGILIGLNKGFPVEKVANVRKTRPGQRKGGTFRARRPHPRRTAPPLRPAPRRPPKVSADRRSRHRPPAPTGAQKRVTAIRSLIREVAGLKPYEKRVLDMIKTGGGAADKRIYKYCKARYVTRPRVPAHPGAAAASAASWGRCRGALPCRRAAASPAARTALGPHWIVRPPTPWELLDALHAGRRLTPIPPPPTLTPHSLGTHKRAINKRADIQQYYADQRSAAAGQ
jgi:large subunit ribosomal protein L36e